MKKAYGGMLIAPDKEMIAAVCAGRKKITIREGYRDYESGQTLLIGCHIANWAVLATITSVRHCKLNEVFVAEMVDDGFGSYNDMLVKLQRFYPDLSMSSPVTIVRWDDVKGTAAKNEI